MIIDCKKLKKNREATGYTQKEMASKVGVSEISYQYYELGIRNPKIKTVRRMEFILGVPLACTKNEEVVSLMREIVTDMRSAKEVLELDEIGTLTVDEIMHMLEAKSKKCV